MQQKKGVAGAVGLLSPDSDSALRRWEVAGPEVCRLLSEYEELHNLYPEKKGGKHHEDYPEFQKTFFHDVQNLHKVFDEICNPFDEEKLVILHTGEAMHPRIESCLLSLLDDNEEKYQMFCKHRIDVCDTAITAVIKNNSLDLPSTLLSKDEKDTIKQVQSKKEKKFAKSALLCHSCRDDLVGSCFQCEVSEYPSAFTAEGLIVVQL